MSEIAAARPYPMLQAAVAVAGLAALSAREVGWEATAVVAAVGGAAAVLPDDWPAPRPAHLGWGAAVALGVAAFGIVRLLTATPLPQFGLHAALTTIIAAVAEEAFFRRFLYGWLARWGVVIAVVGSALAFAAVHVPVYGAVAFPLDVAAGLVLGWQRAAAGTWTAPAITHMVANLMTFR